MTTKCPSCGVAIPDGAKFCSNCGAPLAGAACAACRAPLTPGAKFCHRCGTPAGVGAGAINAGSPRAPAPVAGFGNALPWAVAGIALLALVALAAGQRFGRARAAASAEAASPPFAQSAAPGIMRAPDISSMSPEERAERLYDRIMSAAERGKVDSVRFFLPMALQAYQALGDMGIDQRYDLGRLGEVAGDAGLAAAQADTILRRQPDHLLGLILAARAAGLRNDSAAARRYLARLARVAASELKKALPEYELHRNDIDAALADFRRGTGGGR